jgi:hypothetical protein
MKTILSALAVVMLLGAATAAPADAACWAGPGGWHCGYSGWHPYGHHYWGWRGW